MYWCVGDSAPQAGRQVTKRNGGRKSEVAERGSHRALTCDKRVGEGKMTKYSVSKNHVAAYLVRYIGCHSKCGGKLYSVDGPKPLEGAWV